MPCTGQVQEGTGSPVPDSSTGAAPSSHPRGPVSPSMMEMCTALRRVLGTLLSRGPCVIEGQLRLGTKPALWTQRREEH